MAQEYKVASVKTTGQQDQNNNDMLWVTFEGIKDNALMFAKKHPVATETEYGELKTEKSQKTGKEYLRFRRVQREDGQPSSTHNPTAVVSRDKKEWQPRDDDRIVAQWAIGQAVAAYTKTGHPVDFKEIEEWATKFYAMVDRVKGGEAPQSGYEKAKATAEAIKEDLPPVDSYQDVIDNGDPIDISEIPF